MWLHVVRISNTVEGLHFTDFYFSSILHDSCVYLHFRVNLPGLDDEEKFIEWVRKGGKLD